MNKIYLPPSVFNVQRVMKPVVNPHPPLSAFPAVLLTLTIGLELYSVLKKSEYFSLLARRAFYLVCVISPLTYYTGYWGSDFANQSFSVPEDDIMFHQTIAEALLMSLALTLICSLASKHAEHGKNVVNGFYRLFLFTSYCIVLYTSFLGGHLVFSHGAGVDLYQEPISSSTPKL